MSFFINLVLNVILILFPVLIMYLFFNNLNNKQRNILLEIIPLISVLLILIYTKDYSYQTYYIMCNTLLVFSIINNKKISYTLISIIIVYLSYKSYNYSIFWISLEYIFYLIYFELKKEITNCNYYSILNNFILFKGLILTLESFYLCPKELINQISLINLIIILLVFYLISILIFNIINRCYKVITLSEALIKLQKEKEIKIALFKITHEIKNPLAVCKGYLSMINYNNLEKTKKYIKIINSEINRTLDIMNNFSEYTKMSIKKEEISIKKLIEDTYNSVYLLLKENKIKIEINNIEEIKVEADYERLKQVLINLIKNSIESIKNEGKIIINIKKTKYLIIEIIDNGKGMNKQTLNKINKMFYTTKENGTGIGIPLCKEIIKLHNGKINILSKENIGTKVIIKIPFTKFDNNKI